MTWNNWWQRQIQCVSILWKGLRGWGKTISVVYAAVKPLKIFLITLFWIYVIWYYLGFQWVMISHHLLIESIHVRCIGCTSAVIKKSIISLTDFLKLMNAYDQIPKIQADPNKLARKDKLFLLWMEGYQQERCFNWSPKWYWDCIRRCFLKILIFGWLLLIHYFLKIGGVWDPVMKQFVAL